MAEFYNPNLSDSTVNLDENYLGSRVTPTSSTHEEILRNSGYVPTGSQQPGVPGQNSGQTSGQGFVPSVPTPNLPSNPAVTTSSYIDDYNKQLGDFANRTKSTLEQQQKDLDAAAAARTAAIERDFAERQRVLEKEQGSERATSDVTSFRLGVKGTQYGDNRETELRDLHNRQINELISRRNELINQVQQAAAEGKTGIAAKLLQEDKNLAEQQFALRRQQREDEAASIQNAINTNKLQSDQSKFVQDKINSIAQSGVSLNQISDQEKSQYERQMGLPQGSFEAYYQAQFDASQAQNQQDKIKAADTLVSFLQKIPHGQTVQINGANYTGIGEDKNNQIFSEEDRSGNITYVTVDKTSGKIIASVSAGRIGKGFKGSGGGGGSGAPAEVEQVLGAITNNLITNYQGKDGYVDTQQYRRAYQDFAAHYPKYASKFTDYFPPSAYLNPKDPTATQMFGVKPTAIKE